MPEWQNLQGQWEDNIRVVGRVRKTKLGIKPILDPVILPLILLAIRKLNSFNLQSFVNFSWHEEATTTLRSIHFVIILKGHLPAFSMHLVESAKRIHQNRPLRGLHQKSAHVSVCAAPQI